jgi:hypothetical protein
MQFTLQNDIPNDGVIMLGNAYNATMIGSAISVYASRTETTAAEVVTLSEGSDGTNLGSVGNAIDTNTNSIQRALLGNDNYKQSAIRQYLNSDAAAGSVWTPQNKWDRPPSWAASSDGFLRGVNPDFVSVLGNVNKVTGLNTVTDGGGTETTSEKVFLLSYTEAYCGGSEGTAYDYYKNYSNLPSAGSGADKNRIKYRNGTAKYWWLRSPYFSNAYGVRVIGPSGELYYDGAGNTDGVSPAVCIPLDNINNDPYLQSLFLKPIDPPVPFPTISTYIGENNLSVDTQVQPEKVVLTVKAWREIEAKKYVNGSWTDIVVRRYENGAWVPSPIPENNIADLQGLLTVLEDHWLPGVNDYRSMILVRTNRNDDTANQLCYMLTCYSTNPSPHFASEFLNNRYWFNDYAEPYRSGTDFYLRKFSWTQGSGWSYDGYEEQKRDDYLVPIDNNTYNVYLLRLGSSTQYDNNAGYQYFYDLSAYF